MTVTEVSYKVACRLLREVYSDAPNPPRPGSLENLVIPLRTGATICRHVEGRKVQYLVHGNDEEGADVKELGLTPGKTFRWNEIFNKSAYVPH